MLAKFSVKNFKSFKNELVFDFSQTRDYEFEPDCIKNGIVNKAIIYGYNGVGKSNLALAVMDIITHLTDKQKSLELYENYLNGNSSEKIAEFSYTFKFNDIKIEYNYGKYSSEDIVYEDLLINKKRIIFYDKRQSKENLLIKFKGTETLTKKIIAMKVSSLKISLLKYIKSNAVLLNEEENVKGFNKFMEYVNNMLLFWNLDIGRKYLGYKVGQTSILKYIVENEKFEEFKKFLEEAKLESNLKCEKSVEGYSIYYNYSNLKIDFFKACSSGTRSLVLFYYWLQFAKKSKNKPSLVFIDEFDAFYHLRLSKFVVNKLKEISSQVILTTHNTGIMSNDILRPDCYFHMHNNSIESLANSTDKELRFEHNIEKIYRAGALNE